MLAAIFYFAILPGLSVARQEPSKFEVAVATYLLDHSVPSSAKAMTNPLGARPDPAAVEAGHRLFTQKCETCHAYEGGGRSEIGGNSFPRAPVLRIAAASMSDGEVFYHIRNGIRNTAMPAWNFPDDKVWQLVAYIRRLPMVAAREPQDMSARQTSAVLAAHYVGSKACQSCHQEVYARWQKTAMANVMRDPKTHPDAIAADPATAPEELRFSKDDVAFVYGREWKQRYWKKSGDTYVPLTAQWNFETKKWSKYHVPDKGGDWWGQYYPDPKGDNSARPTAPLCDGCHSVDFNIDTKQPLEWNVGCEVCHGAGSAHVANPTRVTILNPARQNYVQANDTCIQCHSQGQPLTNPIKGQYYDWAVGYHAGLKLSDYWKLEEHKLGETSFTHFPDGTAHKNRMQGNDFVQSLMYNRGVTCFSCHDPHGTDNDHMLRKPVNEICSSCHSVGSQNGPHTASLEEHTHHAANSTGSQCVACHMPKILPELPGGPFVSTHTFHFVTPGDTDSMNIPNACNACHKDKDTKWAATQLASWTTHSIWRMRQ
ncbi:MAG TPA: cytochrome c3 family protein [Rhizomicrobium sp.]|nr:cytochrome c3 family protein [Rhizomicrobium sp.]